MLTDQSSAYTLVGSYHNGDNNNQLEAYQLDRQNNHHQQYSPETIATYYREDTGLNQLNAQQPFWYNKQQRQDYDENVKNLIHQVLARYKVENLNNGRHLVTPVSFDQPVQVISS